MNLPIYQVDAFAEAPFQGNPAAVIPLEGWLSDALMLNIAAENNLSETAFFVPLGDGYQLRWFTPQAEVDLCGHATLATAHVLFEHLGCPQSKLHFQTKSGELVVTKGHEGYAMDFPADRPNYISGAGRIAGLDARIFAVYRGKDDFLLLLGDETELRGLAPDFRALAQLDARGIICTAPGDHHDFVSRCFYPRYGIDEDPVTGSAHTTLIPFWAEKYGKNTLSARQISKRGGNITGTLKDDRVELIGQAVTVMHGSFRL